MEVCKRCNGERQVAVLVREDRDQSEYEITPCPSCYGKGFDRLAKYLEHNPVQASVALEAAVAAIIEYEKRRNAMH
jgi:hypothetical protein